MTEGWESSPENYPTSLDAFNHNFLYGFRYAKSYMLPFVGLEDLRRAQHAYRMRIFVMPGEGYQLVPAYGSVEWRVSMKPGTLIWGMQIPALNNPFTGLNQNIQIFVGANQEPVFNRITSIQAIEQGAVSGTLMSLGAVAILNPPILVPEDGSVTANLSNVSAANELFLLLYCAEPKGERLI
jgi:hypothetical protein